MCARLVRRDNRSLIYTLPAPLGGLNKRDSIADMDSAYAITMDNYIPYDNRVILRKGYTLYVPFPDKITTLAAYNAGLQSALFAVSGHKIYNISSKNNVYEFKDVFLSDDNCHTVQYKNYLYFMNGADIPKVYYVDAQGEEHLEDWGFEGDGLNASAIVAGGVSKQRLWFIEKGTLRVWHAEVSGNIAGKLNCFDLSQVCRFGGHLMAVANWTQDGGQGINDLTVFLTSEGEALIYSGSDLNDASDWTLRGLYKISRPIGYECCIAYQGDLVIISEDGYIPLSSALPKDRLNASQIAFSSTIRELVSDRTRKHSFRSGWQGILYARGGYAMFNVPLQGTFEQHVININTGAWCRFTNINSYCWAEFDKRLYFGSVDGVYMFDEGYSDNGSPIYGEVVQAYTNLGTNVLKKIQLINPRTKSLYRYNLTIYTNTDMQDNPYQYSENIGEEGNSKWNKVKWSAGNGGGTYWDNSGSDILRSQWISNSATGYKLSIVFKTETVGNEIEWYETGIRYETGDGVL